MTRKSSRANGGSAKTPKERRCKDPSVERFRSLEELNQEFTQRKGASFRSLGELTKNFEQQQRRPPISEAAQRAMEDRPCSRPCGVGVLKKAFEGRGFGFITPENGNGSGDVFLHYSDIVSGSVRSLGVGTRVSYDVEFDSSSGRLRAKNVSAVPGAEDRATNADEHESEVDLFSSVHSHSYNRDLMLSLFKALSGSLSFCDKSDGLRIFTVPMLPSSTSGRTADEQDPHLDDEHLIAKLEERLDKETGADALNMETFGTCSGWSFEEAVVANAKLKFTREAPAREVEESTMGASSSEPHSISEDNSEASEDGREASAQVAGVDRKRSWESAKVQVDVLDDLRHAWEVEQSQTLFSAAPLAVFQ